MITFAASLPSIAVVKNELGRLMPEVKSSHRVEALARGLGWGTNASMRAELRSGALQRAVDCSAFNAYLAVHGFCCDEHALQNAIYGAWIRSVLATHPELTRDGFGRTERGQVINTQSGPCYDASRSEMLGPAAIAEFERALLYLVEVERTNRPTVRLNSYNLKHCVERWHENRGLEGYWDREYVSNGMLLVAAFHLGFVVRRVSISSISGYLNVSTASVRNLEDQRKPVLPPPESGEPFRVLGIVQSGQARNSRYCYLPKGRAKPLILRPDHHTLRNLLQLAPTEYWSVRFPADNGRAPFNTYDAMAHLFRRAGDAGFIDLAEFRQIRSVPARQNLLPQIGEVLECVEDEPLVSLRAPHSSQEYAP